MKKSVDDTKILDIWIISFTNSDYDKFLIDILNAKIKQKGLLNKSDISKFVKKH